MSHPYLISKRPGTRLGILLLIVLVSWGLGLYLSISSRPDVFNPTPIKIPRQLPDLTAERPPGLIAARHHVGFMGFSPDGKILALPKRDDGRVELWSLETGKEQVLVGSFDKGGAAAYRIAFSNDSHLLAVYTEPAGITIWNLVAKRELAFMPVASHAYVHDMAFANGDRNLVTLMGQDTSREQKAVQWNCSAVRWEVSTGEKLRTHVFDPALLFKALSRDGRYAVMQEFVKGRQIVFDLVTGKEVFTVAGSGEFVFSDDVSTLVSYDGDQAWVWNVPSGKQSRHFTFKPSYLPGSYGVYPGCLDISSDKKLLAVGNFRETNAVGVISLETGKPLGEFQSGPYPMMSDVVLFSPDRRMLATDNQLAGIDDREAQPLLRLWKIPESW